MMLLSDLSMMMLVIFLPSVFALGLLIIPASWKEPARWWSLIGSGATVSLSLCMLIDFYAMSDMRLDRNGKPLHAVENRLENRAAELLTADSQPVPSPRLSNDFVARIKWIDRFDIYFSLGLDGISMTLILLTTIIIFLALIASWKIEQNLRLYLALILLLETGVIGTFLSLDLFLFFVFYEVMLIPMYFLIGLWGGGRRKYAAIKFVIYTLFGSVCIMVAMIGLYFVNVRDYVDQQLVENEAIEMSRRTNLPLDECRQKVEIHTFDICTLQRAGQAAALHRYNNWDRIDARGSVREGEPTNKVLLLGKGADIEAAKARTGQWFFSENGQYFFFALLFIGFAVKVPILPFHSWLPDAHVEAPTPVSMILAGVLLKLGGYGLMRLAWPICPWAAEMLSMYIAALGIAGIVYGAFVALGQGDFKRLLAYSSISHMGYVILGLASWTTFDRSQYWSWGMSGALYQMLAHGITSAGLFFIVGVIYERAHHREINRFGGLFASMPMYGGFAALLIFANMGLPGLCGFVGELFVMLSAWNYHPGFAIPAILTTILTAGYLLWTWQRVYLGTPTAENQYPDLRMQEIAVLLPLAVLAIALGLLPQLLILQWSEPSTTGLVEALSKLK
jgi:NADH-quinone oxidoreductase subunit M